MGCSKFPMTCNSTETGKFLCTPWTLFKRLKLIKCITQLLNLIMAKQPV